jgi:hypothetical protein
MCRKLSPDSDVGRYVINAKLIDYGNQSYRTKDLDERTELFCEVTCSMYDVTKV